MTARTDGSSSTTRMVTQLGLITVPLPKKGVSKRFDGGAKL
jgi:hypothetical protein